MKILHKETLTKADIMTRETVELASRIITGYPVIPLKVYTKKYRDKKIFQSTILFAYIMIIYYPELLTPKEKKIARALLVEVEATQRIGIEIGNVLIGTPAQIEVVQKKIREIQLSQLPSPTDWID